MYKWQNSGILWIKTNITEIFDLRHRSLNHNYRWGHLVGKHRPMLGFVRLEAEATPLRSRLSIYGSANDSFPSPAVAHAVG